jgi:hypothetical protein
MGSRRTGRRRSVRTADGGRRGRRAVARLEKLVAARAKVERLVDRRIEQAVARARSRGVSWPRIVGALAGARQRNVRVRAGGAGP